MRLTTRIITGIILSIFALALLFIIGFSFTDRKIFNRRQLNTIILPQDHQAGITLPSFKTVIIESEEPHAMSEAPHAMDKYGHIDIDVRDCNLYIDPVSGENNPEMLFFPESLKDFISTGMSNDTLKIRLDMWNLCRKYKSEEHRVSYVSGINLRFVIAKIDVVNKLSDLSITIKNIETDRIKVDSYGNIRIDSCKAEVIEPLIRSGYHKLIVENCVSHAVNMNLDYVKKWNIKENCTIDEVNYTGSGEHHIIVHRNTSEKMNWLPKKKKAKLNLTIQGDTTQILIQ
jgi:hypothetical protein